MDPHFSDDEQLAKLKDWWKRNGTAIVWGGILGISVVVGTTGWRYYLERRAEQASGLYQQMLRLEWDGSLDEASSKGLELRDGYAKTAYAGKSALILAKIKFNQGERDAAMKQLKWAIDNSTETATQHAARLRLAYLLLDEGELDEARTYLDVQETGGFQSEYEELSGDLYVAAGQSAEALSSYQRALDTLPVGSRHHDILRMKLDDVTTEKQ
ncbi:MAG: tetratricopeptide repeat protein [Gammaproteobacteria bacterium]|nr:tetratricopeptide repeat protein [Gammaproteobacteria bacterium]